MGSKEERWGIRGGRKKEGKEEKKRGRGSSKDKILLRGKKDKHKTSYGSMEFAQ